MNNNGLVSLHIEATAKELLAIAKALNGDDARSPAAVAPPIACASGTRFKILNDDEAQDVATGLIWTRDNVPGGRMNWKAAAEACAKLTLGGHSDWRLPTIKELLSLVDYGKHEPSIDTDVFKCDASYYWSSTPAAYSPGEYAWVVSFDGGNAGWSFQGYDFHVRAVRASQSLDLWHIR